MNVKFINIWDQLKKKIRKIIINMINDNTLRSIVIRANTNFIFIKLLIYFRIVFFFFLIRNLKNVQKKSWV